MKRIIGLTGGIASGKTTVANYLAEVYKLPILDADIYARSAVAAGSPILEAIARRYGEEIILSNGSLDRQKLGEIIFNNHAERIYIENLIHPYVGSRFLCEIGYLSGQTCVLVVPLLFEANMTDLVTEIWVVNCSPQQQLKRLMQRNNLTLEQAQSRINTQMPLAEKAARADRIINNTSNIEELHKQVDLAFEQ